MNLPKEPANRQVRIFSTITPVPFIGMPQAQSIKLGGIAGQGVPLTLVWSAYGASTLRSNINIGVDFSQQPCVKLDQIRSVYIDNLGSDVPIYVNFPDLNYTIVAKPNSEGWYPAYTNSRQMNIIAEGFISGNIPSTQIIVSNLYEPPSVNVELEQSLALWRASPTISRTGGNNSNFGAPALGDQSVNYAGSITATGVLQNNLWGTPLSSGFVYLTGIEFLLQSISSTGAGFMQVLLQSTGIAGGLYVYFFDLPVISSPIIPVQILMRQGAKNIKLDATQTWQLNAAIVNGGIRAQYNLSMDYTINPN